MYSRMAVAVGSALLLSVSVLSAQTSAPAPLQGDTLTLDQVVQRALEVNPDMVQAQSTVANARSAERPFVSLIVQ